MIQLLWSLMSDTPASFEEAKQVNASLSVCLMGIHLNSTEIVTNVVNSKPQPS